MKKFQLLAHKWWDEEGDYAALHSMNDIRVPFIRYGSEDRCFIRALSVQPQKKPQRITINDP